MKPDLHEWASYRWWVILIVATLFAFMTLSRYLPPLLYGYVMINKRYWKIDLELEEMQRHIDQIIENEPQTECPLEHTDKPCDTEVTINEDCIKDTTSDSLCDEETKKRLEEFLAISREERRIIEERKQRSDAEKLANIHRYCRLKLIPLGFSDEELFQVCECVTVLVRDEDVLSSPAIQIRKKRDVLQADLKNFAWNIGNQYRLPRELTARFVCATFSEWFKNSEHKSVEKTLRTTTSRCNIEIDENILNHLDN